MDDTETRTEVEAVMEQMRSALALTVEEQQQLFERVLELAKEGRRTDADQT